MGWEKRQRKYFPKKEISKYNYYIENSVYVGKYVPSLIFPIFNFVCEGHLGHLNVERVTLGARTGPVAPTEPFLHL